MRYPAFLPEQGTIGFVAPSFGAYIEPYHTAFLAALEQFKREGFQADLGPNCFEGCGIGISNTPEKCGQGTDGLLLLRPERRADLLRRRRADVRDPRLCGL